MKSARSMEKMVVLLLVTTGFCISAYAQQASQKIGAAAIKSAAGLTGTPIASTTAEKLPLRRVVLYKSGVGYFEHDGKVRGNEDVEIDLTSSQLDDVLKSLTALDLSGGRVVGASYNSQEPAGHQLESLPVPVSDKTTLSSLLEELRGARLEVHTSAGAFTGRLLSVEEKSRKEGTAEVKVDQVSLLGESGEVRQFALEPGTSVRFADHDLEQELTRALGLLDASHQEDTRHLVLTTLGSGERQIRVSYISEVPVWKTTYRIVLPGEVNPSGNKPLLQGWAVVDNTVGEDWNDVELSLAAGAPQSFIQQISQPYYVERPEVPMPKGVLLGPQTHAAGFNYDLTAKLFPTPAITPPPGMPGRVNGVGGGSGGGVGSGFGGGFVGANTTPNAFLRLEAAAADSAEQYAFLAAARNINAAKGGALGDLFEYRLKDRVTIRKNQSALVPIIQTDIAAEKVSLWNAGLGTPRPLRALWLTNSSPLVLDGGDFSVVDANAFAGEGLVESIQPGEKRLISYAADLAMQVVSKQEFAPDKITHIRVIKGVMIRTVESRQSVTYTVRNEDTSARTLILEHPVRNGWKLSNNLKPEEQSAGAYRFRIEVPSKETKRFTVEETSPVSTQFALNNLDQATLDIFVTQRAITPELEQALRQILAQKDALAKLDAGLKAKQAGVDVIVKDQDRLRENMKALKGTPEEKALTQRYTNELDDQETQIAAMRKEISSLEANRRQAQQELDNTIAHLTFDTTM
ncbi:MAG TPA: hypothetical protein VKR82_02735 [Candidatus Acidoferrales bacterium]|nr:hypothetical protein [Candidatus Acidoferrales bacterium]